MKRIVRLARTFIWRSVRSPLCFSVLLLASAAFAPAQEVTSVFVPPSTPLAAGSRSSLWLYCFNNSSNSVSRTFDPSLDCTFTSESVSLQTALLLNTNSSASEATIPPGGFVKEEYLLDIPLTSNGAVSLAVSNYNPFVILVEPSASGFPKAKSSPPSRATSGSETWEFFENHISFYEPIYFILGTYPAAEFQFSLKYKVIDLKDTVNPLAHLYFAYTQTSFWELFTKDPAFYDTSYKPSVFFYYPDVFQNDFFQLDLQGGGEHESNGRGGTQERSLNTFYLQPKATFDLPANLQLSLQPRAWVYIYVGNNDQNIDQYRGYADMLAALTWLDPNSAEKVQLSTKFVIGDEGSHAGLLFDLRFNLAGVPVLRKFNPAIQVQYFQGYGQTLIQYNQTSNSLRAGLCLWY
jgi:outer membrane phospholipase A